MDWQASGIGLNRRLFSACWSALGARDDTAFEVLLGCYAERQRAYHTAEHIEECLAWWQRLSPMAERPMELAAAIYFHDAVYDPGRGDNEAQSCQLFGNLARAAAVEEAVVARVEALVLSTQTHRETQGDAALLSDIDLSVLGSSPARYARYERTVREEYAMFDDATYHAGRARVLCGFLERLAIYHTEPMASLLERQARINLGWALLALDQTTRTACSSS